MCYLIVITSKRFRSVVLLSLINLFRTAHGLRIAALLHQLGRVNVGNLFKTLVGLAQSHGVGFALAPCFLSVCPALGKVALSFRSGLW